MGNNQPVELTTFIETLEEIIGKKAQENILTMQAGDVEETYADIGRLSDAIGFKPVTPLRDGALHFVAWFKNGNLTGWSIPAPWNHKCG